MNVSETVRRFCVDVVEYLLEWGADDVRVRALYSVSGSDEGDVFAVEFHATNQTCGYGSARMRVTVVEIEDAKLDLSQKIARKMLDTLKDVTL